MRFAFNSKCNRLIAFDIVFFVFEFMTHDRHYRNIQFFDFYEFIAFANRYRNVQFI